jgi:hypothetical protein
LERESTPEYHNTVHPDHAGDIIVAFHAEGMMRLQKTLALALLVLSTITLIAGETISDPQLGFELTVPDGFIQDPSRAQGDIVYVFKREPAGDQKFETLILVTRLKSYLGREKLDPKDVAARSSSVTLTTEKWKDFDIDVFRVPEEMDGMRWLTFNAQVPLKPKAIQIGVAGEAAREEELRMLLRRVLNNLDGPTNWLTNNERSERLATGITKLIIATSVLAGVSIGIGLIIWQAVRKTKTKRITRKRKTMRDDADAIPSRFKILIPTMSRGNEESAPLNPCSSE